MLFIWNSNVAVHPVIWQVFSQLTQHNFLILTITLKGSMLSGLLLSLTSSPATMFFPYCSCSVPSIRSSSVHLPCSFIYLGKLSSDSHMTYFLTFFKFCLNITFLLRPSLSLLPPPCFIIFFPLYILYVFYILYVVSFSPVEYILHKGRHMYLFCSLLCLARIRFSVCWIIIYILYIYNVNDPWVIKILLVMDVPTNL